MGKAIAIIVLLVGFGCMGEEYDTPMPDVETLAKDKRIIEAFCKDKGFTMEPDHKMPHIGMWTAIRLQRDRSNGDRNGFYENREGMAEKFKNTTIDQRIYMLYVKEAGGRFAVMRCGKSIFQAKDLVVWYEADFWDSVAFEKSKRK